MKKIFPAILAISMITFFSCEEETDPEKRFLEGTYALNSLFEHKISLPYGSVNLDLEEPSDTVTTITINASDTLVNIENIYTDGVDGVQGTAILKNDLTAFLEGSLFTNVGGPCNPLMILATFASAGTWSVDEINYTFELNLETDALDIEGTFTFEEESGLLTIYYTTINDMDSLKISQVNQNGTTWDIDNVCIPVTTTTDRIMSLTLSDQ